MLFLHVLNIGNGFLIYISLSFVNSLGPDVYNQTELIISHIALHQDSVKHTLSEI